jgi:cysteine-rich repeat protein
LKSRLRWVLAGSLLLAGCGKGPGSLGPEPGPTCVDSDRDGFGHDCPRGRDCDDRNAAITNQCRTCARPDVGCACSPEQEPISCFMHDEALPDGNVMCHEGTRYCRQGAWSSCEDVHGYEVIPERSLTALLDPAAAPRHCSICEMKCFNVSDLLTPQDGGAPGGGLEYAAGGGLKLGRTDGGVGDAAVVDAGHVGCTALTACCDTMRASPAALGACMSVVNAGNTTECTNAIGYYCPSVIVGPIKGCTQKPGGIDSDCDGIPDVLDECTPATIATNPRCNGTALPIATTNNQTVFHVLDQGESGQTALQLGFQLRNADVYFLMDMSYTMLEERDKLKSSMTTGNVVECALLKNCCDKRTGASQTACNNTVAAEDQAKCKTAEATYCDPAYASLVDCPDLDFDGKPDNFLKDQGVVGAVRCLVGSSWFGAGTFQEIPFRDGYHPIDLGGHDDKGSIADRGSLDENTFRHYVDMTVNTTAVRNAIASFRSNKNYDYPEADMVALYSLLTGEGQMFGHRSVSVPERLGAGCPADTFGYPCFRKDSIPIVVLFTDDPMHNGPPVYGPPTGQVPAIYDPSYVLNGKAPTSRVARFTPAQSESFATAMNLGDVRKQFMIVSGNLTPMSGDYPSTVTGCAVEAAGPDAVYRFTVSPELDAQGKPKATLIPMKFALNVRQDTVYNDNPPNESNVPSPATQIPVALSLYRGVPTSVQTPVNVGDTRINAIPSGPDLAYLTYLGTSAGSKSAAGFLGGISGCGADGKTHEVIFTFRPTVNAKVVIDTAESSFGSVVSLHEGLSSDLPANPSGSNKVVLSGTAQNDNDTFNKAIRVDGADSKIDGDYVTYLGDLSAVKDSGSGAQNSPAGASGLADYNEDLVSCDVNPTGSDAVYRFNVETARRVRIDTEGSNFKTVISLHDGLPPETFVENNISGNGSAQTAKRVGSLSSDSVTGTWYVERSNAAGTTGLTNPVDVAPMCGMTATGSEDAYYSFRLSKPTRLSMSVQGRTGSATAGEAYNTPGMDNASVGATPSTALAGADPAINEFVTTHSGSDDNEYVEVSGKPNTNYASYRLLQIEGDSSISNLGRVTASLAVGSTDARGLWRSAFSSGALQGGTSTFVLVDSYTGTSSTDLDADDDGILDLPAPWTRMVDSVAIHDGGGSDKTYAGPLLTVAYDGGSTTVGGASRIPSGKDSDLAADWVRNDFDGDGLPGIGFDPIVFLYSSPPGTITTKHADDRNGDGNLSDSNTHNTATLALDLGDVYGQVDTKVVNASLAHANATNDYNRGVVSCNGHDTNINGIAGNTLTIAAISGYTPAAGNLMIKGGSSPITSVGSATSVVVQDATKLSTGSAKLYAGNEPPGNKDQVYKFTPSADGTVRIEVNQLSGSAYPAVAIYDGPPPISGAIGAHALFDAGAMTPAPAAGCSAYSRAGHLYWFCANAQSWTTAQANCNVVGSLVRIDDSVENAFVGDRRTATQAWIGGQDRSSSGPRDWVWRDNDQPFWSGGSTGSAVGGRYAAWATNEPGTATEKCAAYNYGAGSQFYQWADRSCSTAYSYVCEVSAPSPAPPEAMTTAYPVGAEVGAGGDLYGRIFAYSGSTRRMENDVDGLLMSACGATQNASDAVFKITPSTTTTVTIDTSGSAFPAIVGLFDTTINLAGYKGCDAPGVAPGVNVTQANPPASALPLSATLVGGKTYYAVIKGTAASPDGAYKINFADVSAGGNGAELACAKQTTVTPARVEADFSANHTYYVVVESTDSTGFPYGMVVHSLYKSRAEFENPLSQNEHAGSALVLDDPYRAKSSVVSTSTAGMAPNYKIASDPSGGGVLMCGGSSAAPDAVYKFRPSIDTKVKLSVDMPGKTPTVSLFEGQPGSSQPSEVDLRATNGNEDSDTAYVVSMTGPPVTVIGNTSAMTNDIDGSLLSCGASTRGRDAVFKFTLGKQTQVKIDASASTGSGMMGDPVIALFRDAALERPASVKLENDTFTEAGQNPSPTPDMSGQWMVYDADMANLTAETQAQLSVAATNVNEQVNPTTLAGALDLGDVNSTKVTVGGASTNTMVADYDAVGWCSPGIAASPDAIYRFHSSKAGNVRVSTAKPTPGFDTVLALYDGQNGAPLRAIDGAASITTVNLNNTGICGNGIREWNEQCDDGNAVSGDHCSSSCQLEAGVWRCSPGHYAANDGCDCGCGIPDPDCANAASWACSYCGEDTGSCALDACPSNIDPDDNAVCVPTTCGNGFREAGEQCDDGNTVSGDGCTATCLWQAGTWNCDPALMGDGVCDCGCGLADPDCASASCVRCGNVGGCNAGACPGAIDPANKAVCTSFGGGNNPNDGVRDAITVDLGAGGTRQYLGNTQVLTNDFDASSQLACGAVSGAPDAVFDFELRKPTTVKIDAVGANPPMMALFRGASVSSPPAVVALAPDDPDEANYTPSPTPQIKDGWVRYAGNIADLTSSSKPQTDIDNQSNVNNDTPTEWVDPLSRRVTVLNATTAASTGAATHPAPTCGGADGARDQLYRFVPSVSGDVRISAQYPDTAFDPVLALYDGTDGPPLTRADLTTVTTVLAKTHESEPTAQRVPLEGGDSYVYTGSTAGMSSDVPAALFPMCGAAGGSPDAVFSFSLSKATDVEISAEGSGYDTVLGVFDSSFVRPSVTQQSSLVDSITQLYDRDRLPRQPDAGCTTYDWNLHRYWLCATKRTWDGARAKCQKAGSDLVVIDTPEENAELQLQIASSNESYLIGLSARQPYQSWGNPVGLWVDGTSGVYRNFSAAEPDQPLQNAAARMRHQDGAWVDVPSSYQTYRYICEDNAAPALPDVPTGTAPAIADVFGHQRHFVGSTAGQSSTVTPFTACGAAPLAPDAVFRFDLAYQSSVSIDISRSFAGSVVGLFKEQISSTGYMDGGQKCALASASAPQLQLNNLAQGRYYVVLTGTAASGASSQGSYEILLGAVTTDPAAFVMENDTLDDAQSNPIGPIEGRWVVKTADMAHLQTNLLTDRIVDMPGADTNDTGASAKDLGNTAGQQITVTNASTAGMSSDYPAPSCGTDPGSADAIYMFTPDQSGAVRIQLGEQGHDSVIALYGGAGGALPLLKSEAPAAPIAVTGNDAPVTTGGTAAQSVTIEAPVTYTGNVSALGNNVPAMDAAGRTWDRSTENGGDAGNMCNPAAAGQDAFFQFTLSAPTTTVVVDSTGTDFGHTLALWRASDTLVAPAAVTAERDTRAAAGAPLALDDNWYVLQGNTSNLRPGGDTLVTRTAGADFQNKDNVQDLGVLPVNTQLVTTGANTAAGPVTASYLAATLTCGSSDLSDDMVFKVQSAAAGRRYRIAVNNPSPGFPPVLALFDGQNGDPATAAEVDPEPTVIANTNDTRASAYNVTMGMIPVSFSGNTSSLPTDSQGAASYRTADVFGGPSCGAGSTSKDAFFHFELTSPAHVQLRVAGDATAYAHTLALYDAFPASIPAATTVQYDSYTEALAGRTAIDRRWLHYDTPMAGKAIEGVTTKTLTAGTHFQNAAGVQDLYAVGSEINSAQFRTSGADTTYSNATYAAPSCGGTSNANDMLFRVHANAPTTLRVGVDNPTPGFNPLIAVFNGVPLTGVEAATATTTLTPGNANEAIASAQPVQVGARATFIGNASAMASNLTGSQFLAPGHTCSAAPSGADAFLKLDVRTLPAGAMQYATLWLDADDASSFTTATGVSQWRDKSGKNHHVAQASSGKQPSTAASSQNLRTGVDFDGVDDTLVSSAFTPVSAARSVFAVWKLKAGYDVADPLLSTGSAAAGFSMEMSAAPATGKLQFAGIDIDPTPNDVNAAMLVEFTQASDGTLTTFKNGTPSAPVGVTLPPYDVFRLGSNHGATKFAPMVLYELLILDKAVDPAERVRIEGYLAHKWGLAGSLPLAHAHHSSAPALNVEVDSATTAFAHTLAFFGSAPATRPIGTLGTAYANSDGAILNSAGSVTGNWFVRDATTSGLGISELTSTTKTQGTDFTNANTDATLAANVPDLDDAVGRAIKTTGADSTGRTANYPTSTMVCSSADSAPDAIFKFTPTSDTRVAVRADATGWTPVVGLFDGTAGLPLAGTASTAPAVKLGFAPSNYTHASYTYANAVSLTCAGTSIFDSSSGTFTAYPCGGTQPQITGPVAQSGGGGPQVYILSMSGFTLGSSHTLSLVGSRPVILAIDGTASISGTIHADASGTTPGAGGDWSCGSSAGGAATGSSSTGGGGGGGGAFGTAGGLGGNGDGGNRGVAGAVRGTVGLSPLIGGCKGGTGGGCGSQAGAAGGGAFQIAARGTLTVTGTLRANGAAGVTGCTTEGGGTGGGSGGGILLEAGTLSIGGATLQAQGGNGGAGASSGGASGSAAGSSTSAGGAGGNSLGAGGGGGGGGHGRVRSVQVGSNGNEASNSASTPTVSIGALQTYQGNTSAMTSNLTASYFSTTSSTCHAAGTGDALFKFTLSDSTPVRISSAGSAFDTTLALWKDHGPDIRPRPSSGAPNPYTGASYSSVTGSDYDTKQATPQTAPNHIGDIDGLWKVFASNTTGLRVDGLTYTTSSVTNSDSTIDLASVASAFKKTSGASTSSLVDKFPESTLGCSLGSSEHAPDEVFQFTGTAGHTMRVGVHNPAAAFNAKVALFEGASGLGPLPRSLSGSTALVTSVVKPTTPASSCTWSYSSTTGHGYYRCTTAVPYATADDNCENRDMFLARPRSSTEVTYLDSIMSQNFWIGAGDPDSVALLWQDDGDPVTTGGNYTNWGASQPSSGNHCTLQNTDTTGVAAMKWRTIDCGYTPGADYVCEVNMGDLPTVPHNITLGAPQRYDGDIATGTGYVRNEATASWWNQKAALGGKTCATNTSAPDTFFEFKVHGPDAFNAALVHRYSFKGRGTRVFDSGGSHGTVYNTGQGGEGDLFLSGNSSNEYVALPSGLISAMGSTSATIEMWITWRGGASGSVAQQPAFDFGDNASGSPKTFWSLTPAHASSNGKFSTTMNFTTTAGDSPSGDYTVTAAANTAIGTKYHVVTVFDGAAHTLQLYVNNVASTAVSTGGSSALSQITDTNLWLGDSNNTSRPELRAVLHELRIHNKALSAAEVSTSYTAGEEPIGTKPVGVTFDTAGSGFNTTIALWDQASAHSVGALDCAVTSGGTKAALSTVLAPGTYQLGLSGGTGATAGAFSLAFRNYGATQVGCSASNGYVDVPINSGKTYTAVVKGATSADSGTYTLSLVDMSAVSTTSGCGADNSALDAYFYFDVNSAGTRNITIDMNNSTLAGAFEVFNSSGTSLGCQTSGNSRTYSLAQANNYYVVVRGTSTTAGAAEKPFELSIRDDAAVYSAYACGHGNAATGATITQTLGSGTYYVGVTGNNFTGGATSGAYNVTFEDTNLTGAASASRLACGGEVAHDVTANTPYYVVVKGVGAADAGAYTLHVDDIGAVSDMSCGGVTADDSAPDGYFAFSVSGTKDVTIDLSNSSLEAVYELWKDNGASDTRVGCGSTAGSINAISSSLIAGNYYVKVRGTDAAYGAGEQAFQISVRDDDVQRATDCIDGVATTGTTLQESLVAGTYYVGIKPQAGQSGGAYRLTVRDTALAQTGGTQVACTTNNTVDLAASAGADYYVLVKGESASEKGSFGLTVTDIGAVTRSTGTLYDTVTDIGCGADPSAPDVLYAFSVDDTGAQTTKDVEISIANSFNGAFQLFRDDGSFTSNDNISTCSTGTHTYPLATGNYFVVVKGRAVAAGAAEQPLSIAIRDADASGSLVCADGTSGSPATIAEGNLPAAVKDATGALLPGHYYAALSGQTGQNGAYELMFTDMEQITGAAVPLACTTAGALTSTLAASRPYYVVVKGNSTADRGAYTLSMTDVTDVEAIGAACPTDLAAPDGYAAFSLAIASDVRIDMSGSTLVGAFQVFDDVGNAPVSGCGCAPLSTPRTCSLPAGSYHVVYRGVDAAAGNGQQPFKLVLQDMSGLGSIACSDGAIAAGATITKDLTAGSYYVGIVPNKFNASTDLDYRLRFRDAASAAATGAPEIACNTSQIDVNVNANDPYYVVVKGKTDTSEGSYALVVQDLSGVPSFGCNDDVGSGDAFFSFEVTAPGGSDVTIDSQGSTLQTVLALFPEGADLTVDTAPADGKPDSMIRCDSSSGPGQSSLINDVHLAPGQYFVVVRARQGAPDKQLPFTLSVRDENSLAASHCDATDGGGQAIIRRVLQPGTYWTALKGSSASGTQSGNYSLRFRDYAPFDHAADLLACNTDLNTITHSVDAGKPYYVLVKGQTASEQGAYRLTAENLQTAAGMGCSADDQSPDAFYKFTLSSTTKVRIDTAGSTLDTVIALYSASASSFGTNYAEDGSGVTVGCNDNAPGLGTASAIEPTLAAGEYYVVVKGKTGTGASWGSASKPFKISIRDMNTDDKIACAPASASTLTQALPAGEYRLVVSANGAAGNPYDLRFRDLGATQNSASLVACDDTADSLTYNVAANRPYYVIVKGDGGASAKGAYTLSVEGLDSGAAAMGCGAAGDAPDAFFKFHVSRQTDVTIDTQDSALDTVLGLYPGNASLFTTNFAKDAFGNVIDCDNDGGPGTSSLISATLAPGDYYAVVKGTTSSWGLGSLPFKLSIRDDAATRALDCAGAGSGGPQLTKTLPAGDYAVVLSDTNAIGSAGSGGAYSINFRDLTTLGQENGLSIGCAEGTLDGGGSGVPVKAGKDYYVIVKGKTTTDSGSYTLNIEDVVSSQAAAGSAAIACAAEGSSIDTVYPAGNYYAVVSGPATTSGGYELQIKDPEPFYDYSRITCDADSGPNGTSVIEADLQPGMHYVVVKADGAGQTGAYQLNIRDADARSDHQLECADGDQSERLEHNVLAGHDYTVLLKGDAASQQGNYNIKLYDEAGLGSGGGKLVQCEMVCPDVPPYNSCRPANDACATASDCCSSKCTSYKCVGPDPAGTQACASSQRAISGFSTSLAPDTYYLTVKARKSADRGFYELQVGNETDGSNIGTYVPPTWTEVRDAVIDSGAKLLPVLSCPKGGNDGRCDGTERQARALALTSGALDPNPPNAGKGLVKYINPDGTGIGSGLALAVRDLAQYLEMDVTLGVVDNPGFTVDIQKCTTNSDPSQVVCANVLSKGCGDTTLAPKDTISKCAPGSTPKFAVQITNPFAPNNIAPNPSDPYGGYHFKLQLVGDHQYLLEEIPVYIIPTQLAGPPAPDPNATSYRSTGVYEQVLFAKGCNYYQIEGEGPGAGTCDDGIDNNNDGLKDRGNDANSDKDYLDANEYPPDPGCIPGSCLDGINNDADKAGNTALTDYLDPNCITTEVQDWTDLFFTADVPSGTKIIFDMCTGALPDDLEGCTYSRIASITSSSDNCGFNAACQNVNVGGTLRDGFCGKGGQCQFIDPPKVEGFCTTDAECPSGLLNGLEVTRRCNQTVSACQYVSPPAEIGNNLREGQNGRPHAKVRVTLQTSADRSQTPTLFDWSVQYECRSGN